MNKKYHPLQQIYKAKGDRPRFRSNEIVKLLLKLGPFDLNKLHNFKLSDEDWLQFYQLIGYSVDGFAELNKSQNNPEVIEEADRIVEEYGL